MMTLRTTLRLARRPTNTGTTAKPKANACAARLTVTAQVLALLVPVLV